tara:strand:- start:55 stop:1293 length:1239 start_codon:yes stop_codon:yes gene_type:complete
VKYISFVIPSRNNLPFLKQAYNSIRDNIELQHEIVMLDDASTDGTWKWMTEIYKKDKNVIIHKNYGPERLGHTILYDEGVKMCTNEIFSIFHADMVASPNYVINMIKHLEKGKVVSATRIEPPLHPPGPEKIVENLGMGVEEFDDKKFKNMVEKEEKWMDNKDKTTSGIFAPWMMYKEDFESIGGHDPLFAPMELEDSDIFNRMYLKGYELIQSRDAFVYHMTCRGSRFKDGLEIEAEIPLEDGTIWYKPKDSEEYTKLRTIKIREWLRKWGHMVQHDELMMPKIPPKYDIGFQVMNTNINFLRELEPWCSCIYLDGNSDAYIDEYIRLEQPNTLFDLTKRVKQYGADDVTKNHDIVVQFDAREFDNNAFQVINNMSEILKDSGEVGTMEYYIFRFFINSLDTHEKDLILVK